MDKTPNIVRQVSYDEFVRQCTLKIGSDFDEKDDEKDDEKEEKKDNIDRCDVEITVGYSRTSHVCIMLNVF